MAEEREEISLILRRIWQSFTLQGKHLELIKFWNKTVFNDEDKLIKAVMARAANFSL